jgi:hypothetical protein
VWRLTECFSKGPTEVRRGQASGRCERSHIERLAVSRVGKILGAQQVSGGR